MIKIENTEVVGWEHAIRGARNPMNSWERSDSKYYIQASCPRLVAECEDKDCFECEYYDLVNSNVDIGENDLTLMNKLANGGPVHATYRRFINVYVDITAPLYFYKEMDRYRIGVEKISCSTMHTIHKKEFTLDDFSCDHLCESSHELLDRILFHLNYWRNEFINTKNKEYWWQMIQLLPSSYNQKRTYMFSYEALAAIYKWRKDHKLDEWREFCKWIETLPYSELITGGGSDGKQE